MSELLLDRAGRRRSPAKLPGFHAGRSPRNQGVRYPADPPKVEEIIAVMRAAGDRATSTTAAAPCSCDSTRAGAGARSARTSGAGTNCGRG